MLVDLIVESAETDEPVVSDGNRDAHARFIVGLSFQGDGNFWIAVIPCIMASDREVVRLESQLFLAMATEHVYLGSTARQ